MDNKYSVYVHTLPDGKSYVGITNREPEQRWNGGRGYKHQPAFFSAILYYGWRNITHEIIATGLSEREASEKENELIVELKSDDMEYGYNVQTGGVKGFTHNKETREKISVASKKRWQDKDYREKVSARQREVQSNPDFRKKKSEWTKKRYNEDSAYRERLHDAARKYMNTEEAKKVHKEAIQRMWNRPGYKEAWHEKMSGENGPSARAVEQWTIDNCFVRLYKTCKEAAESAGVSRSCITACAKGRQKTAGGYVWRYAGG